MLENNFCYFIKINLSNYIKLVDQYTKLNEHKEVKKPDRTVNKLAIKLHTWT